MKNDNGLIKKIFCRCLFLPTVLMLLCPFLSGFAASRSQIDVSKLIWRLQLNEHEIIEMLWVGPLKLWAGRYEVTNGQYRHYNPAHRPEPYYGNHLNDSRQPAVEISWYDAQNFAGWLNRNYRTEMPEGFEFRLPSEQEWEFYASAGRQLVYPWGNQWPPPKDWNYRGEEGLGWLYRMFEGSRAIAGHNDGFIVTAPVEQSGQNAWGLYGTGGNAWEWCSNWLDSARRYKVLRGGGWNNYEQQFLRLDHRGYARPEQKNSMVGFRLVLAPIKD